MMSKKIYNAISNDIIPPQPSAFLSACRLFIGPAPVLSSAPGPLVGSGLRVYQLAFLTPGILPCSAISRNIFLEIPKYRIYPRGRPVS